MSDLSSDGSSNNYGTNQGGQAGLPIEPRRPMERWGSRLGVILAVMGSAIGLGNFLRFPGLAAKYGGGHFMIPYFVAFFLLGLPIAWAEWAIGRRGGRYGFNSTPGIFFAIWKNRLSPYLGVLGLIIPVGIYMYYVFIEAWCLYYALQYLQGGMSLGKDPAAYGDFFATFIGAKGDGSLLSLKESPALAFLLLCFVINFVIIYRGLSKGIEFVTKYAIPLLFVCAVLVLIRVLTLGTPDPGEPTRNVLNGLGQMWNTGTAQKPLLVSLANPEMWLEAAGQIFFSLSVGFGIIITYSSYLKKNDDVLLSGTTSASGNIFAEVALGGLITIPAAFIFLGPDNLGGGTFSLGFKTLPNVFANMPLGSFFGFLWFFLLFLAAVTSSLSMLQPAVAFLEEGLGVGRRVAVTILGFVTLMGSLFIVYFSGNTRAMDMMDFWIGSVFIYILATLTIIIFGWVIGAKKGLEEAKQGSLLDVPNWVAFIIKYVSPAYLLIVFGFWLYGSVPKTIKGYLDNFRKGEFVEVYTLGFIVLLMVFLILLIAASTRNWRRDGRGKELES